MNYNNEINLTITAEDAAQGEQTFHGDWDNEGVVTTYLPRAAAEALAEQIGIRWNNNGEMYECAHGATRWTLDEALAYQLAAIAAGNNNHRGSRA